MRKCEITVLRHSKNSGPQIQDQSWSLHFVNGSVATLKKPDPLRYLVLCNSLSFGNTSCRNYNHLKSLGVLPPNINVVIAWTLTTMSKERPAVSINDLSGCISEPPSRTALGRKTKKKSVFCAGVSRLWLRVFQSCSWGSPAAHVRDVALPQHTWFKLMARYGASAELHDEPIIWIRCVGTGKHLQHAGQETLRNRTAVTWAFGSCKLCKENTQILPQQIHVIAFLSTNEMQNITKPLYKITRETIKE